MRYKQLKVYKQKLENMMYELNEYMHDGYVVYHARCIHKKQEGNRNESNEEIILANGKYDVKDLIHFYKDLIAEAERTEKEIMLADVHIGKINDFDNERRRRKFIELLKKMYICSCTEVVKDTEEGAYMLDKKGNPVLYKYPVHVIGKIDCEHEWIKELYAGLQMSYEEDAIQIRRQKNSYEVDFEPKYQVEFTLWDNMYIFLQTM